MVDLKVFPEKLVCYNYGLCKLNMSPIQSAGMTQGDVPANLHSLFSRRSSKPQNINLIKQIHMDNKLYPLNLFSAFLGKTKTIIKLLDEYIFRSTGIVWYGNFMFVKLHNYRLPVKILDFSPKDSFIRILSLSAFHFTFCLTI